MNKVMKDIFLKLMFNTHKKKQRLHMDLPFLHESKMLEKAEKLVTNLHDKNVIHIKNLKQTLNFEKISQSNPI